jgi:hypothetical protein
MISALPYRGCIVARSITTACLTGSGSRRAAAASPCTTVGIADPVRGEKWSPGVMAWMTSIIPLRSGSAPPSCHQRTGTR